jgi:hypothetical protein
MAAVWLELQDDALHVRRRVADLCSGVVAKAISVHDGVRNCADKAKQNRPKTARNNNLELGISSATKGDL